MKTMPVILKPELQFGWLFRHFDVRLVPVAQRIDRCFEIEGAHALDLLSD